MYKKMITGALVSIAFCLCLILAGCEKDEIKVQRSLTVEDQVVEQDTVVE